MNFDDVTTAFCALAATPGTVPSKIGWKLWSMTAGISQSGTHTAVHPERLSYRWTSPHTSSTNTAHKEGCLPSWGQMMVAAPELPSPSDWGWKTGGWEVNWTTLPEQACRELLKCGGRSKGGCKCVPYLTNTLFAYLISNFYSLGAICVVASMLK